MKALYASLFALTACGSNSALVAELRQEVRLETGRSWFLLPDGLTRDDLILDVAIDAPTGVNDLELAVGAGEPARLSRDPESGRFQHRVSLAGLAAGDHHVRVTLPHGSEDLASSVVHLSAPLYVVVSTDWDDTRFGDEFLTRMELLRERHPRMRITHFFAPYHYTDPAITASRKRKIDDYIKMQRDRHGDEIGLHIHGWCHFVRTANVPCNRTDTFDRRVATLTPGDTTGYTAILDAYPQADMARILAESIAMYERNGLGRPSSFRAGGWSAGAGTLRALVETGFRVDSSAVPPHTISQWNGYVLFDWLMKNWKGITETSQPYYPSPENPAVPGRETALPLLEVPDNGSLVDYRTAAQMSQVLKANYPGGALAKSTVYQIGYHPPSLSERFATAMDLALSEVDAISCADDKGPAVFVNISELTSVWPQR